MSLALATLSKPSHELASTSAAATAKALVEAKFAIARHPDAKRNPENARVRILESCKRPGFAKTAKYAKPVGGKKMIGPSVRFAEEALRAWGNVDIQTHIVYDDAEKIIMHVAVLDLESNTSYGDDVSLKKTVERKFAGDDRNVIGERVNSNGEKVFIVEATEDEMANKLNAAKSKVIRNSGLRLIPQDYIEEGMAMVDKTLAGSVQDPAAEVKKIIDAFADLRVKPSDLEQYLGHKIDQINASEINDLRTIYSTIKDGEATWAAYVKQAKDKADDDIPMTEGPAAIDSLKSAKPTETAPSTKEAAILALRGAGVSVDHLRTFLKAFKVYTEDTSSFGDFDEFPASVYEGLSKNNAKLLKQAIKSYQP